MRPLLSQTPGLLRIDYLSESAPCSKGVHCKQLPWWPECGIHLAGPHLCIQPFHYCHPRQEIQRDYCVVIELSGRNFSVSPFSEEYASIANIPIATVATAFGCPDSGQVFILIFNEALYFGERMAHTLLCPNQLRAYGVTVDDTPTQYNRASTHSLHIPDSELCIPLELDGIISGFTTRAPTPRKLNNTELHIEMSSDMPWNPNSKAFGSAEDNAKDNRVQNRKLSQVS